MKKLSRISAIVLTGVLTALPVLAQDVLPPGTLPDLSNGRGAAGLIIWLIRALLLFAGLLSVLFLIIGGFQYIMSGANEDLAKRGKTTITNAIIGLIVVILSYTVIRVIAQTFTSSTI